MLLRRKELEAIKAGQIDLAFRRWAQPRLRAGTRMRTAIGLVEVTSVEPVAPDAITDDDARRAGAPDRDKLIDRLTAARADQPIHRVGLRFAGADPRIALRENADLTDDELDQITKRLNRLDKARGAPWTEAMLALIEPNPRRRPPSSPSSKAASSTPSNATCASSRSSASPSRSSAATASRRAVVPC